MEDTMDPVWSQKDVGMIAIFKKLIKIYNQTQKNDCKEIYTEKV